MADRTLKEYSFPLGSITRIETSRGINYNVDIVNIAKTDAYEKDVDTYIEKLEKTIAGLKLAKEGK